MSPFLSLCLLAVAPTFAQEAEAAPEPTPEEVAAAESAAAEAAAEAAAAEAAAKLAAAEAAAAEAQAAAADAQARVAELEARAAALDELPSVGFKLGKGLKIESPDGLWSLNTHMRAQFKALLAEGDEGAALGFQIRRARLTFKGKLGIEDVSYKVQLAFSPEDVGYKNGVVTTSPALDWHIDFKQLESANLRVGQYKAPFTREQLTSSGALNLVDRSLTHNEFTLDRDIGVMVYSKAPAGLDKLRYNAAIMSGEGKNKRDVVDVGLLYVARVDFMPLGAFKDMKLTDFDRSDEPKVAVGAAFAYLADAKKDEGIKGNTPADGGTTDTLNATVDGVFKLKGLTVNGAWHWRQGTRNPGTDLQDDGTLLIEDPRDGWGWYLQLGYLLPLESAVEVAGRFSQVRASQSRATSLPDGNELTAGLNWYINGSHMIKLAGDIAHTWGHGGVEDGDTRVWAQLQIAY